jgi:hypothetical protein
MFSGLLEPQLLRRFAAARHNHPKSALRTCRRFVLGLEAQAPSAKAGMPVGRVGARTGDRRSEIPYRPLQVHYCGACERFMTLARSIARLGHLPRLDTWRCASCGKIETIECRPS